MPRRKNSANSASNSETVAKVSTPIGDANHSVSEIQEYFAQNKELSKLNYENAKEALRRFVDPNKSSSASLNTYNRDNIRQYLQKPASNEKQLRGVARYLYFRSQILFRLVHWYAGMWDLRCRNVEPNYDLIKGLDKNALKQYNDTLAQLEIYNLQETLYEVLVRCYLEDVCYFLWFRDDTGAFPFILNPDECKIIGRYMTGDLAFAIDMSAWKNPARQNMIEWLGEPLKSMYAEYQRTNTKYIQVPDEYAGCFKFGIENLDIIISPFAPLFQSLASLLDVEDLQAIQANLDVFKMIILPMKSLSGTKKIDDFEFTPDLVLEYFDRLVDEALPSYVTAAPVVGDGVDVVDFSSTSSDNQVDRVANAQKNIFNTAGGGAVLNASMITSTAAFNAWLKAETEFATSSLIGQINGFTNRMLSYDVSNPCKVNHFELSVYTKDDFRKSFLEANQYSYSYRLALGTLYGMSEKETLAAIHFEQDMLGLQNLMIYPLQSSYTSTGVSADTDPVTGGAPEKDASELSPSGDANRNR